eukprot:9389852-Ditylum_brightwellii.AAC.1
MKRIQQVVGALLYYSRSENSTINKALNSLGTQQNSATKQTKKNTTQLLNYMATHPDVTIRYYALDMILNIHSDASYLSEKNAKSTAGGHYFLVSVPQDHQPILLNGAIHMLCTIIKNVCASAAEAELASMFMNAQQTLPLCIALKEMGHPQPPTLLHF